MKKIRVVRRQATLEDVDAIFQLDQEVWAEFPATKEMFASRISTFPEGQIVAVYNGRIIGYLGLEFVNLDISSPHTFTWNDISDMGTIRKSHNYDGDYMYGVAMTISPEFQGCGVATQLLLSGWGVMVKANKRGTLVGSRIPGFHEYSDRMSAQEYVLLKNRDGEYVDPELRLWKRDGGSAIAVLPSYMYDPQSMDYGVLVYRPNPFFGWPFRRLVARFLATIGPKFIRSKY